MNSRNMLAITITEFQLMIKKQTKHGKKSQDTFHTPNPFPINREQGPMPWNQTFLWNQTS